MIGDSGERHALARSHAAPGQYNITDAGNNLVIFTEGLVKVAPVEQDTHIEELSIFGNCGSIAQ